MEDNSVVKTLTQGLFLAFALVIIMIISLGISLDFSRLKTWEYWISVVVKLALVMITFNIIYRLDRKNKINTHNSRFFIAYATNRMRVARIYEDKRVEDLERAIKEENERRLQEKCERLLSHICSYIKYSDMEKSAEQLIKEFGILPRLHKRFYKVYDRIKAGRVKAKKLMAATFLTDKQLVNKKDIQYDYSVVAETMRRNTAKMITFLLTTMLFSVIVYTFAFPSVWTEIVSNITILLGAIISGFTSADKDVKRLTYVYENRNNFIFQHLEITDKYEPQK